MTRRGGLQSAAAGWAASVGIVVHAALPDGTPRDVLFVLLGAGAAVAVLRAQRRMTGVQRRAWALLALGVGAWVLGDALWTVLERGLGAQPYPSAADVAYLVSYPLLATGLVRAFPAPAGRRPVWWLDAFLMVGGLLLALWLVVLDPAVRLWQSGGGTGPLAALYPVGDAVLMVALARASHAARRPRGGYRLIVLAVAVILVADVLFQVGQLHPAVAGHLHLVDSLWLLGYVALAGAARRQAAAGGDAPGLSAELTGTHFLLMALSASVVPVTLISAQLTGRSIPVVEVCTIGVLMVAAMMTRFWGVLVDLRQTNVRLAHDAVTDPLTGLANPAGLRSHVEARPPGDDAGGRPALVLIGLDGYRDVVETLGHELADEMLRAVARELADAAPPHALAARISRDLFALSITVADEAAADAEAERIVDRLGGTVRVSGMDLTTGAALGVAVAPGVPVTLPELARRADVALWSARRRTGRVARDEPGSTDHAGAGVTGTELLRDLVRGVQRGELVVEFQPVTDLATGRTLGAEALVRWQHPVHGLLGPAAFVPAAERTGLIRPVTLAVMDAALRWCATWRATVPGFVVAVNVSAHDVDDPRLVADVRAALDRYGLPASALALEVTETMAMRDVPRGEQTLRALAALGVPLAVDDYGVGYGSLDYLRRLPFDVLKVDRAFVAPAVQDPVCASILRSTVTLGHALGMHVVAEGVEDPATLDLLVELGCDAAQGWALGRPAPPEELTRRLLDASTGAEPAPREEPTGLAAGHRA